MKITCEVSRPHLHPGPDTPLPELTKKRDLSQPGYWVANERAEKDGVSYAIVMPRRDKELYEERQAPHVHLGREIAAELGFADGETIPGELDGIMVALRVKVGDFVPRVHLDHVDAESYGVKNGDIIEI